MSKLRRLVFEGDGHVLVHSLRDSTMLRLAAARAGHTRKQTDERRHAKGLDQHKRRNMQ